MKIQLANSRCYLILVISLIQTVPIVCQAGEDVLFQMARSILNEQADPGELSLQHRRSQCLRALVKLRREKEYWQLLQHWTKGEQDSAESQLSICWENELYWTGLNFSSQTDLPLSRKLASMAGLVVVPPEKLIKQVLEREQKPFSKQDQSMVELLRFAARYDQALKSNHPDAEKNKLVPVAIELVPQVLQLLQKQYPSGGYHTLHYHPVRYEVAQCGLAMLTIIPAEQHTPELRQLSSQIDDMFGLGCVRRGWYAAFETGIELLARKDERQALLVWQSSFLDYPEIASNESQLISPESRKASPELAQFVSGVNVCLHQLQKETYKERPEDFKRLLQEPDSELWRFNVLLSLESARLRADQKLLQLVSNSLLEQSDRLYSDKREEYENSPNDLCYLYFSAFRTAQRLNDRELQRNLLSRLLKLYPQMGEFYTDVLYDQQSQNLDWFYLFSDLRLDREWLPQFEVVLLKDSGPYGYSKAEFGMLWATYGTREIKGKAILTRYKANFQFQDIAWGAGYAAGRGRAALPVGATWLKLRRIDPHLNTVPCFVDYCSGYVTGKHKQTDNWDARFLRVLDAAK